MHLASVTPSYGVETWFVVVEWGCCYDYNRHIYAETWHSNVLAQINDISNTL